MQRAPFNDGWEFRPKVSRFAELSGVGVADWAPITLPHDAMIGTTRSPEAGPASGYFNGGVWEYRKTFELTDGLRHETVLLEFEGVYRDAVVYVNDTVAAQRAYGYSSFFVPIDHLLRGDSENEVRVEARAGNDSRWYSGAGIYRNVWLLRSGRVHLVPDGVQVRTPEIDNDRAVIAIAAEVRNRSDSTADVVLRVEIVDGGEVLAHNEAPVTVLAGETLIARRRVPIAEPARWSVDHPNLYTCRATLLAGNEIIDEGSSPFGIRSLSVDAQRGLRINGEPVELRGACVHHDNGPLGAATIDRAEERRVELLKAAGFNAIRSAHNPMSKAMLDACDRIGMIVMDETFDMWTKSKSDDDYSLRFAVWWETDVESMVRKDFNHPSVVLYSIGNEVPDGSTPTGVHLGRRIAEKVRALDDTRFVTQAVTGLLVAGPEVFDELHDVATERSVDEDTGINTALVKLADIMGRVMRSPRVAEKTVEAFSFLDVAGYNYMETRFEIDRDLYPDRVIAATESHPAIADRCWEGVTGNANVIGDFTWTGWDYLGEAGIGATEYGDEPPSGLGMKFFHGDYPWITAWCGDIDITGQRRPQSYYREIVYGLRSDPYIAVLRPEHHGKFVVHSSPWSWSDVVASWSWDGHEGKHVTVEVYAAADEVELLVNGRSLGRQATGRKHGFRAQFETEYEPGELAAVAFVDGREAGRMTVRSATGSVVLDVRVDRAEIAADASDLAFVEITLVDAEGNLYNMADRQITVELEGPGVLQGFGSANPRSDEGFCDNVHTTFDGRALAIVRPTGAGTIMVTVSADGCMSRTVAVDVQQRQ